MSKVGIIEYDKLAIGQDLMKNNIHLSKWSCPLPSLTNGYQMFFSCYYLTAFASNLSSLTDGRHMFDYCENLESFTSDLSNLKYGDGMFDGCGKLSSFSSDSSGSPVNLSNLTDGQMMFHRCYNLAAFSSDLSNLTDGRYMFEGCYNFSACSSNLSSLTDGYGMLSGCYNLSSFTSELPSLTDGSRMFNDCVNLTSFSSKLGSLKGGHYMFYECNLDAESLSYIANNINNITNLNKDKSEHWTYEVLGETKTIASTSRGRIDIGHEKDIEENVLTECADILIKKGWEEVYFNREKQKIYEFSDSILLRVERKRSSAMLDLWDTEYYGVLTFSGKRREGRGCTLTFTNSSNPVTFDTLALSPSSSSNVASGDLTLSVEGCTVTLTVTVTENTMTINLKEYGGRADRVSITSPT